MLENEIESIHEGVNASKAVSALVASENSVPAVR